MYRNETLRVLGSVEVFQVEAIRLYIRGRPTEDTD
jgi:hypothetical protein